MDQLATRNSAAQADRVCALADAALRKRVERGEPPEQKVLPVLRQSLGRSQDDGVDARDRL